MDVLRICNHQRVAQTGNRSDHKKSSQNKHFQQSCIGFLLSIYFTAYHPVLPTIHSVSYYILHLIFSFPCSVLKKTLLLIDKPMFLIILGFSVLFHFIHFSSTPPCIIRSHHVSHSLSFVLYLLISLPFMLFTLSYSTRKQNRTHCSLI